MTVRPSTPNELALHLVIKDVYSVHNPALHVMTPADRAGVVAALSMAGFTQQQQQPLGELPEVTIEEIYKGGQLLAVVRDEHGITCQWELKKENIEHARRCGHDALAVANRIEEYFESEEYEAKVLQERRDALTIELGGSPIGYADTFDSTQRAVDRIIHLENELKAAAA